MNDDALDRALRAARPHTAADDGWADSPEGARALAGIRQRVQDGARATSQMLRRPRALGLTAGLAAATAAAVAVGLLTGNGANTPARPHGQLPLPTMTGHAGPTPAHLALVSYASCDGMLADLRRHTAAHVQAFGLYNRYGYDSTALGAVPGPVAGPQLQQKTADGAAASVPDHSTTNVQEAGVGEPDIVETDGRRIVSVSDGVLRVVDASSHAVTASLDLSVYAGADTAQLLMSGDRVLVVMGDLATPYYGPGLDYSYPRGGGNRGSTVLLVDLSGQPRIIDTLHTAGGYVDARMVDGIARVVVATTPKLVFPQLPGQASDSRRLGRNRDVVRHAPLSAWLPTYQVSRDGRTVSHTVPCQSVSHPTNFTGTSMVTVYSLDLAGDLADPHPITLAADGTTVYASTSSLYVADANGPQGHGYRTELHRFDITSPGKPVYLGSGTVPGQLLDSYSMSEYDATLRVVATTGQWSDHASTSVYVLDAATLDLRGRVTGLGHNQQVHAVRFLGPLAYVVTFRSVDPLYVIDLSDPEHPRTAAALELSGYSDYLHSVADGRLLGVGENVNGDGIVSGLQVSLFDISAPTHPRRLDRIVKAHTPSETPIDPHAFLYWPAAELAVMPIDSWDAGESGAALVVHVSADSLRVVGTIRNPAVSSTDSYGTGIERTLVIGDQLWTMSSAGLQASDLHSLARSAWVPFE